MKIIVCDACRFEKLSLRHVPVGAKEVEICKDCHERILYAAEREYNEIRKSRDWIEIKKSYKNKEDE